MAETLETTDPETLNPKPMNEDTYPSDSDSDSDDEAVHIDALEKELAQNPSNYEAHLNYITSMRKLGLIDKLRQARETMSLIFPLTPNLWQEWAKDEASLASGNETFAAIEKLYERGVHDYLSISLWCDYIKFVQQYDPVVCGCSQDGISKMRDLLERALTAGGLHVTEGNRIWEVYIEYERAIYHSIDDSNKEEQEKQAQRIRSIFHRQLSVPLDDSKSTLLAYKNWEVEEGHSHETSFINSDEIPSQVESAYRKAMEMYQTRAVYEEKISRQDEYTERLQNFMTYLKFEQSSGNPTRVQILYERAITEFPISSDLWLAYTRYLDQTLKASKVVRDVFSRATRNCPWIRELWVHYLLSLERGHASEKDLSTVFEQSLLCTFSSYDEYLDLFLTRIDGFRRRISLAAPSNDALNYAVIRDTFQRAVDYLSPGLANTDGFLQLHVYWARLEWNLGKDIGSARGVWESFLKTSGSLLEAWKQYIAMEIETGHIDEARCIYKKCYSKRFSGTGSEDICYSWLRFEREFGTLEDYDHADKKVTPRLKELQLFRSQQESKTLSASGDQEEDVLSKRASQKRKMGVRSTEEPAVSKRQKGTAVNPTDKLEKQKKLNSKEEKIQPIKPQAEKPESTNAPQTKHQYSQESYKDQCTAFVSNLSHKVKDEHLHGFFRDVGGVTAIRLLKDKFTGKPRGLAYIDFADDEHLALALAKNKQTLLGKKVSIARSDPRQGKKESSGRGTRNHGKGEGPANDSGSTAEGSESQIHAETSRELASHEQGADVHLRRKNTFAVPRAVVRPLGWSKNEPKKQENQETPKSNDEFRKMFLKQ